MSCRRTVVALWLYGCAAAARAEMYGTAQESRACGTGVRGVVSLQAEPTVFEARSLEPIRLVASLGSRLSSADSVVVHRCDNHGVLRSIANLQDDGRGSDAAAGDGLFSGSVRLREEERGPVWIVAEVRTGGSTYISNEVRLSAIGGRTAVNPRGDFWAFNTGDSIMVYWAELPTNECDLRLFRALTATGPWTLVGTYRSSQKNVVDMVDGTTNDWFYRAEALSDDGEVLKRFEPVRVPEVAP